MTLSDTPPVYRSYLLRFWEERADRTSMRAWRCSLEDPLTGNRHGFASLKALMDWLNTELNWTEPGAAAPEPDPRP